MEAPEEYLPKSPIPPEATENLPPGEEVVAASEDFRVIIKPDTFRRAPRLLLGDHLFTCKVEWFGRRPDVVPLMHLLPAFQSAIKNVIDFLKHKYNPGPQDLHIVYLTIVDTSKIVRIIINIIINLNFYPKGIDNGINTGKWPLYEVTGEQVASFMIQAFLKFLQRYLIK